MFIIHLLHVNVLLILLMLLMNLDIKLRNSLVMCVYIIHFSLYSVHVIVIFERLPRWQIYREGILI